MTAKQVPGSGDSVVDVSEFRDRALARLPFTNVGLAQRIVLLHGHDLAFVPGLGWHTFDGARWRRDGDGEVVRRAKATACELREVAARLPQESDAERKRADELRGFANKCEHRSNLEAGIKLAESEIEVVIHPDQLDADPMLLNIANGTVDLRTGGLREHDRDDLLTQLTSVRFDADATCPVWLAFLARIFADDKALIAFIKRAVGYTLTGNVSMQVLFILHGRGANGKSVFIETIAALLGTYAASADAGTFTATRGQGIPNDLARLPGARLVRVAETEEGAPLARQLVKRVTGEDSVPARFLYREFFEFMPEFKLWLVTNHLPSIPVEDRATWRRLRVVPFAVTIPFAEQDRALMLKLRKELPGILNWAIEGCLEWNRDHTLALPEVVREASAAYRSDQDTIGRFLAEECHEADTATAKPAALRAAYEDYCADAGVPPASPHQWRADLERRGFEQRKTGSAGRFWRGIELAAATR